MYLYNLKYSLYFKYDERRILKNLFLKKEEYACLVLYCSRTDV